MKRKDDGMKITITALGRTVETTTCDMSAVAASLRKARRNQPVKPLTASQKETMDLFCSIVRRGLGKADPAA